MSGEVINNESWLCSPLEVIGTGRDDKDQYLIIRWLPVGESTPTTAAIPLADIGEREGWRTLKAGGVNVTTKRAQGDTSRLAAVWRLPRNLACGTGYGLAMWGIYHARRRNNRFT